MWHQKLTREEVLETKIWKPWKNMKIFESKIPPVRNNGDNKTKSPPEISHILLFGIDTSNKFQF